MQDWATFEAIKTLKYRYFRALDGKDWDLMAACLCEDIEASYDSGKYRFEGRDALMQFFRAFLDTPKRLTLHQGHHPEIECQSAIQATAIWYLEDTVIDLEANTTLRGTAFYRDEYVCVDGCWLIQKTGYKRIFEEVEPRRPEIKLTRNCFDDQ